MAWPFTRRAALPDLKAVTPPVRLLSEAMGMNRNPQRQRNYTAFLECINTIPNVLAAVSVIAYNFAAAELQVFDAQDDELDPRDQLPALYTLLKQPNARISGFEFKELLSLDYSLTGNAIVAMDSFSAVGGMPTALYRLRPDWVRIVATADGEVYYGYDMGGFRASADTTTWYADEEILHARGANPLDDYWGLGTIEAGQTTFETDKLINEFKKGFFDRGAILEGILTTDQVLTPQQSDEVRTQWRVQKEGGRNRFRTAVLGMGTTYQPIQEPLGNIKIDVLSRMSKDDVFMLFGVPLQLAGDFSSGNYHNSQQALSFFYQNTMAPLWRRFEPMWDKLLSCFGDYHSGYADNGQDPDFLDRARAANYLAQTGAATRNQILIAAGIDPYPDDDPLGSMIITTARNFELVNKLEPEAAPPSPPIAPPAALPPVTNKPAQLPAKAG